MASGAGRNGSTGNSRGRSGAARGRGTTARVSGGARAATSRPATTRPSAGAAAKAGRSRFMGSSSVPPRATGPAAAAARAAAARAATAAPPSPPAGGRRETEAAVRAFLERRGGDGRLVSNGLDALLSSWEGVAEALEKGYPLDTLDDYLNDMDLRQILQEALQSVPAARPLAATRLDRADAKVRALLVPHRECLWGERLERSRGWTAAREWWYFMRPARPGPGLTGDLGL